MTILRKTSITILVLAFLWGLATCYGGKDISRALDELVQEPHVTEVRLADLMRFDWEFLYLFDAYTARENICEKIRVMIKECARRIQFEWVAEGHVVLVFLSRGGVVHAEQHENWKGEFKPLPQSQPLTPKTAVFRIVKTASAHAGDLDISLVLK